LWRTNDGLTDKEFQEELSKWGVASIVFREPYWSQFKTLLRADFSLFDKNEELISANRLGSGIEKVVLIYAAKDQMVRRGIVETWYDCFDADVEIDIVGIDGKHLFMENPQHLREWESIVSNNF